MAKFKVQEQQDIGTTSFLKDQLASARETLDSKNNGFEILEPVILGQLPEQEQGNLEILSGLHAQLQSTMAELSRAQEQRVYLSSLLDQCRRSDTTGRPAPGIVVSRNPLTAAQVESDHLGSERASLLGRFTPEYPDVVEINRKIAQQKSLLAHLRPSKSNQAPKEQGTSAVSATAAESSSEAQLRSQLEANRIQMEIERQRHPEAAAGHATAAGASRGSRRRRQR